MANSIGWGIIGLGNIAQKFAKDLSLIPDAALMAVASRSIQKALSFKDEFKVPHAFDSYKALFECEEVEVVYIALPHTEHLRWSIMAMEHGKHVLCEKPLGVNLGEVQQMINTSKKHNVFLMEALWSRFIPAIQKAKDLVEGDEIGTIGYLHADFAFFGLDRDREGRLLNPALAGGSLLDIGIYPVFLAYLILGLPDSIEASAKYIETGAEIQIAIQFTYPSAHAVLFSGLSADSPMEASISGSDGTIVIHSRWHESQGISVTKDNITTKTDLPTVGKGYTYEIEEVHRCLVNKQIESHLWSHRNSLELIGLLDKIRDKAGITFPFE
jgi:predicted dehydrogenase